MPIKKKPPKPPPALKPVTSGKPVRRGNSHGRVKAVTK